MLTIIIVLSFILSIAFLFFYIYNYSQYFEFRKHAWFGIFLFFLISIIPLMNFEWLNQNLHLRAIIPMVFYFILWPLIFKINILNSLFLTLNYILKNYASFMFAAALMMFIKNSNLSLDIVSEIENYYWIYIISFTLSLLFMFLLYGVILKEKMQTFFKNKNAIGFSLLIQVVMIINLSVLAAMESFADGRWYNIVILVTSFSILPIYFLARLFLTNINYLVVYKYHTKALENQLKSQLDHYRAYEMQTHQNNKFKHDFNKILNTLNALIKKSDYKAIEHLVDEITEQKTELLKDQEMFSNNLIIDSMLTNFSYKFDALHTKFHSFCYIPKTLHLSDLDLIRLFHNIMDNIHTAIAEIKDANLRSVNIESYAHHDMRFIKFTNATNKKTYQYSKTSNHLLTTKSDIAIHGYGLSIIDDMMQKINGFSTYSIDSTDPNIDFFSLTLQFPS